MRSILEYADEEYLAHHGIKGQKWGIRRYQNPDGTLTEAGKRRLKPFRDYESIANKNAELLYREANKIKSTNDKMHQRYDGRDGYKRYSEDAYSGSKAEDYGLTEKDFKKWMTTELSANITLSDLEDKANYEKYTKAAKAWEARSVGLRNLNVADISNKDFKAMKRAVAAYKIFDNIDSGFSLDDLVIDASDDRNQQRK